MKEQNEEKNKAKTKRLKIKLLGSYKMMKVLKPLNYNTLSKESPVHQSEKSKEKEESRMLI